MKKSFSLIFILSIIFFSCNSEKEDKRPNILFIMSDDHAYQAISSYGYNLNNTPNIDRIAKEGAIFKNSFVTNSIIAFLEWDLDIQQSVSLPHAINKWGKFEIEESLKNTNIKPSLELMGYETKYRKYFSGLNAIYIGEMLEGGTDPRREGIVLGN